jgi:hypothetical protein
MTKLKMMDRIVRHGRRLQSRLVRARLSTLVRLGLLALLMAFTLGSHDCDARGHLPSLARTSRSASRPEHVHSSRTRAQTVCGRLPGNQTHSNCGSPTYKETLLTVPGFIPSRYPRVTRPLDRSAFRLGHGSSPL